MPPPVPRVRRPSMMTVPSAYPLSSVRSPRTPLRLKVPPGGTYVPLMRLAATTRLFVRVASFVGNGERKSTTRFGDARLLGVLRRERRPGRGGTHVTVLFGPEMAATARLARASSSTARPSTDGTRRGLPLPASNSQRALLAARVVTGTLLATRRGEGGLVRSVVPDGPSRRGRLTRTGRTPSGELARFAPDTRVSGPDIAVLPNSAATCSTLSPLTPRRSLAHDRRGLVRVGEGPAEGHLRRGHVEGVARDRHVDRHGTSREGHAALDGCDGHRGRDPVEVRRQRVVVGARQQRRPDRARQPAPDDARIEGEAGEPLDRAVGVDREPGLARHDLHRPVTAGHVERDRVATSEREPLVMAARADSGVMPPIWMPPTDTVAGTCSEDHTQSPAYPPPRTTAATKRRSSVERRSGRVSSYQSSAIGSPGKGTSSGTKVTRVGHQTREATPESPWSTAQAVQPPVRGDGEAELFDHPPPTADPARRPHGCPIERAIRRPATTHPKADEAPPRFDRKSNPSAQRPRPLNGARTDCTFDLARRPRWGLLFRFLVRAAHQVAADGLLFRFWVRAARTSGGGRIALSIGSGEQGLRRRARRRLRPCPRSVGRPRRKPSRPVVRAATRLDRACTSSLATMTWVAWARRASFWTARATPSTTVWVTRSSSTTDGGNGSSVAGTTRLGAAGRSAPSSCSAHHAAVSSRSGSAPRSQARSSPCPADRGEDLEDAGRAVRVVEQLERPPCDAVGLDVVGVTVAAVRVVGHDDVGSHLAHDVGDETARHVEVRGGKRLGSRRGRRAHHARVAVAREPARPLVRTEHVHDRADPAQRTVSSPWRYWPRRSSGSPSRWASPGG